MTSSVARPETPDGIEIDAESFTEASRAFWRLSPTAPERLALRDALITHLAVESADVLEEGDYESVIAHLVSMSEYLSVQDVESSRIPSAMTPVLQWVVEHGSPRGDEGRVMGALRLLHASQPSAPELVAQLERIERWGVDARRDIPNPIERFGGLIRVWEQVEQIAPTGEVLTRLARLYREQRESLIRMFASGERPRLRMSHIRIAPLLVQRAPLDIAAVYVRHNMLSEAAEAVRELQDSQDLSQQLLMLLERAGGLGPSSATALGELASGFSRARPSIALSICRGGLRRFPEDVRFPLCLARAATESRRFEIATGWYAQAIGIAPDDREVYDEAIERLEQIVESGHLRSEPERARSMGRDALRILEERERRWPDAEAEVSRADILMHVARAAASLGDVTEAERLARQSLSLDRSRDALVFLGRLMLRTGQPGVAGDLIREALDLAAPSSAETPLERAYLLQVLGESFASSGREVQARRMYREALSLWTELLQGISEDSRSAIVFARQGVLESRLGNETQAHALFDRALELGPGQRGPYSEMLAHLVTATPNVELAQRVLRRAHFHVDLDREWRIYFGLWVQIIAGRASADLDSEVLEHFVDQEGSDSWFDRLAAFGRGELSSEDLRASASTSGERAEAAFYGGMRLLAQGESQRGRAFLEAVLETEMVDFYEFAMAEKFLREWSGERAETAE